MLVSKVFSYKTPCVYGFARRWWALVDRWTKRRDLATRGCSTMLHFNFIGAGWVVEAGETADLCTVH